MISMKYLLWFSIDNHGWPTKFNQWDNHGIFVMDEALDNLGITLGVAWIYEQDLNYFIEEPTINPSTDSWVESISSKSSSMLMDFNEILMNHQASIWLKLINLKIEEFFHCMVMEFVGWNHKKHISPWIWVKSEWPNCDLQRSHSQKRELVRWVNYWQNTPISGGLNGIPMR